MIALVVNMQRKALMMVAGRGKQQQNIQKHHLLCNLMHDAWYIMILYNLSQKVENANEMLSHRTGVHLRHGGRGMPVQILGSVRPRLLQVSWFIDSSSAPGASFCTPCGRGEFNDQEVQGSCQNCQPGFGDVGCWAQEPQEVGFEFKMYHDQVAHVQEFCRTPGFD